MESDDYKKQMGAHGKGAASAIGQRIFSRRKLTKFLGVGAAVWWGARANRLGLAATRGQDRAKGHPLYYFEVVEVAGPVDDATKKTAKAIVEKELHERAGFASEAPAEADAVGLARALQRRRMRGFKVSLKFERLTAALQKAAPGSAFKRLAVGAKLSLYGSEIPTKKLAFSGTGESLQIVEIYERQFEKEKKALIPDVIADAVKQAADQAVHKLAPRPSAARRKRRR